MLHRHGATKSGGQRYRCKDCRKVITVVDGKISQQKGRNVKRDWRHDED